MASSKKPLDWFLENIEFLVEDVHLGDQVDIYFDSVDFVAIILGMYKYYASDSGTFRWKKSKGENDVVLVHCLASAGWLGKLVMLPPHHAEFLSLLQNDFNIPDVSESPLRLASKFLRTGFDGISAQFSGDLESLQGLEGDKLVESFGGRAELAKEFFKLLQCVKGSWRTRLMEWDRYILLRERRAFDAGPFLNDEVFVRVKQVLDKKRHLSMNNFSDALAVAILARRVAEFQENPQMCSLPLFFDHAGTLREAIKEADVVEALSYRRGGKEFSVLRDWRYFFFRATFGRHGREPRSPEELESLLKQGEEIRDGRRSIAKDAVRVLGPAGLEVDQMAEYMREFRFFGNIWLQSWKDDLQKVLFELGRAKILQQSLGKTIVGLQSEEIKGQFWKAKEALESSFKRSAELYQGVSDVLKAIESRVRTVRRGLVERSRDRSDVSDIVLVLGSFRFPFSDDVHAEIGRVLSDLASDDVKCKTQAQKRVFSALSEAKSGGVILESLTLNLLLGVLWATELDREILELADSQMVSSGEDLERSPDYVLLMLIWLAALLRRNFGDKEKRHRIAGEFNAGAMPVADRETPAISDELHQALRFLDQVEKRSESEEGQARARVAVSLAYINFHFFVSLCPDRSPLWSNKIPEKSSDDFLDRAIELADLAWSTNQFDERLRVYALNQLLYYITEGVRRGAKLFSSVKDQLDHLSRQLEDFQNRSGWHYRYDDTLARYYGLVGRERGIAELWERGMFYARRALQNCFGDPLIIEYYRQFDEEYAEQKKRHQRPS